MPVTLFSGFVSKWKINDFLEAIMLHLGAVKLQLMLQQETKMFLPDQKSQ
jgi:hypothetical protein